MKNDCGLISVMAIATGNVPFRSGFIKTSLLARPCQLIDRVSKNMKNEHVATKTFNEKFNYRD